MQQAGCKLCKSLSLSFSHPRCLFGFTFLRATEQLVSWACCCLMTATNACHKMLDNCHKARDLAPQVLTARFTPLQTYPAFSYTISNLSSLQIDIQPPERETIFSEEFRPSDPRNVGPCGGFSAQYACMCDFHGVPYREEVAWDVDTIYLSHDTRLLNLRDFDHLEPK